MPRPFRQWRWDLEGDLPRLAKPLPLSLTPPDPPIRGLVPAGTTFLLEDGTTIRAIVEPLLPFSP